MTINKDAWQERLTTRTAVPATEVVQAAEVIQGLAGSWAAAYSFSPGLRTGTGQNSSAPAPFCVKTSKLGVPGFPEINFAPYAYGTNRFGPKGGSFLGHPISFAPVGPTGKHPLTTWRWQVTDNTGGGTGDELTMTNPPVDQTVETLYGIDDIPVEYPGGLYAIITTTGNPGELGTTAGGLGDGYLTNQGVNDVPLVPLDSTSKYEIFRVISLDRDTKTVLTLDTSKRLSSHFTIDDAGANVPFVESIVLVQPQASRMVVVPTPGETLGAEKTFAVVPPARALNTDEQYPLTSWTTATWQEDSFPNVNLSAATEFEYLNKPSVPIGKPKGRMTLRAAGSTGGAPASALPAGRFGLLRAYGQRAAVGDIIRVYDVTVRGAAQMNPDSGTGRRAPLNALMGGFEVLTVVGEDTAYYVRRIEEMTPESGQMFVGGWLSLCQEGTPDNDDNIELQATIHDPITALWTDSYYDVAKLESVRLRNLIDPSWVRSTAKMPESPDAADVTRLLGESKGRADRAIFDTRSSNGGVSGSNADPGSLLDLGFRMVIYPAIARSAVIDVEGNTAIRACPDWSRPITTNEVVLDPSQPEVKQYITVDYSNGMVLLSHTPTSGSDVWPGDMTGVTDNLRGELILFACCVPYSREEGQMGTSIRATASTIKDITGQCAPDPTGSELMQADAFSSRTCHRLTNQTVTTNHDGTEAIILSGLVKDQIPASGFFEILSGTLPTGDPLFSGFQTTFWRGSIFGYSGVTEAGGNTTLNNVYGGGQTGSSSIITDAAPAVAVWRRDITLPQDTEGIAGAPYQYDTTYGGAKRSTALRFEDSTLQPNVDGTMTVIPNQSKAESNTALMEDLFSSWILSGCQVGGIESEDGDYIYCPLSTGVVLIRGVRQTVLATTVAVERAVGNYYVYLNSASGNTCVLPLSKDALPLSDPEDILLAKVEVTALGAPSSTTVTDLRYFLRDVDRRTDLYVGEYADGAGWASFQPHFRTLKDAVDYANELGNPSSGDTVQTFRIRVVGRTVEAATIVIGVDGLVIEGALQADGSSPFPEITWNRVEHLIDLAGYDNLVFRNLPFRFIGDATPTGKYVMIDTVGGSTGLVVDHCVARGYVDGLLSSGAVGALVNPQVTHNTAPACVLSGVYGYFQKAEIHNNIFTSLAGSNTYGAIHMLAHPTVGTHSGNSIRENITSGFKHGVYSDALGDRIETNYVSDCTNEGVLALRAASVSHNYLTNVHTTDPGATAAWVGLWVKIGTAPCPATQVVNNFVIMPDTWTVDSADSNVSAWRAPIVVEPTTGSGTPGRSPWIAGNQCFYDPASLELAPMLLLGDYMTADANPCNIVVWGTNNTLLNNTSDKLLINFDLYGWWYDLPSLNITTNGVNNLSGNTTITTAALGDSTIAIGNVFGGGGADSIGEGTYVYTGCRLVSNTIVHLKDFDSWVAAPFVPASLILIGNTVTQIGEDALGAIDDILPGNSHTLQCNDIAGDAEFSGGSLLLTGNRFDQNLTMTASTRSIVHANRVGDPALNDNTVVSIAGGNVNVTGNMFLGKDSVTVTVNVAASGHSRVEDNLLVQGGQLGGPLTITGGLTSVKGNQADAIAITTALQAAISGNTATNSISISGNNLTVSANTVTNVDGYLQVTYGASNEDITVIGNKADTINVYTKQTTASGNVCFTMNVGDTSNDIAHLAIEGNYVEEDIIVDGVLELTVLGNVMPTGGKITLNEGVDHFTVQGNRSQELQVDGSFGTVTGNLVWYANGTDALTLGGGNLTVGSNLVWGNIVLSRTSGKTTVSANRVYSTDEGATESNIRLEKDGSFTPDGVIITDNFVNGQILLWDTVAAAGIAPPGGWYYVVRNNRATEIFETVITLKQLPIPANIDVENILSS